MLVRDIALCVPIANTTQANNTYRQFSTFTGLCFHWILSVVTLNKLIEPRGYHGHMTSTLTA